MFAARGNVWALDRARRVGRHVFVLAVCAVGIGVGLATPAQADNMATRRPRRTASGSRSRATAAPRGHDRALQRRQAPPPADDDADPRERGALSTARVNLTKARRALNISLISAYKNPQPDPLQAALEARNFGQVLEQFALLDRAQSYNASLLTDIRDYRKAVDASQRVLNRERNARRDTVAELPSLKAQIQSSIASDKQRYRGLRAKVRRLIEERRQAEIAASRRIAEQQRRLQAASSHAGRRRQRHRRREQHTRTPSSASPASPSRCPRPRRRARRQPTSRSASWARPIWGGAAPGGFDCSGLVSWAYAQAGLGGLRTSPARSGTRARTSPRRPISRPATSSSSMASATWACTSAAATSCTRRTPVTS